PLQAEALSIVTATTPRAPLEARGSASTAWRRLVAGCALTLAMGACDTAEPAASEGEFRAGARDWGSEASLRDVIDKPFSLPDVSSCQVADDALGITCWYEKNVERGSFQGKPRSNGRAVDIDYAVFRAERERAKIVIVTGRTESYLKYAEFAYDMMERNGDLRYSLYIIDHRGQGYSDRLLTAADVPSGSASHVGDRGFVDEFDDYVADLDTFVRVEVRPNDCTKTFGLAHSMGGGIMTRYLQQHYQDDAFDGVILTSPMHGIASLDDAGWGTETASLALLRGLVTTGQGWRYVPGGQPFDPNDGFDIDDNTVTHSLDRHRFVNWLFRSEPVVQLGSPTARWVVKSHDATTLMQDANQSPSALDLPILLLQASDEMIVSNNSQAKVCGNLANCTLEQVSGARHEPIFEVDAVRDKYLDRIVAFFEGHLG
ncbi:MAG: alpha/beta fold hydrolase, partial [Deltaproteobacteria bacterium]|nr:alpha/beta fold hydrolase [Deltaproteobacteria bacterium]